MKPVRKKQNKKSDTSELQAHLNAIPGSTNNLFESNIWQFEFDNGNTTTIDFNQFSKITEAHPYWLLFDKVDCVLLNKKMWILLISSKNKYSYKKMYCGLCLFWSGMAELNLKSLSENNCNDMLEYLLLHGWSQGESHNYLSIKSFGMFYDQTHIPLYRDVLFKLGFDWIARIYTDTFVRKRLGELIPKITDNTLTFRDWLQGNNHNHMHLDYGRYYTEHCLSFFENNYPLAHALQSTYEAMPKISSSIGYAEGMVTQVGSLVLQGFSAMEIHTRWRSHSLKGITKIEGAVGKYFISCYKTALFESALQKETQVENVCSQCGLDTTHENTDRMRVVLWQWVHKRDINITKILLKEFDTHVSWSIFLEQIANIESQDEIKNCKLPTADYYDKMGLHKADNTTNTRQLIYMVRAAGLTAFIALTGWRRSELGFDKKSISFIKNNDRLDQYSFPWRYQIAWHVKKTHKTLLVEREITFNVLTIVERLRIINNAGKDLPCLYKVGTGKHDPHESITYAHSSVRTLWRNFVWQYSGFIALDQNEEWWSIQGKFDKGIRLTDQEQLSLNNLLSIKTASEWNRKSVDLNLKHAWLRARKEWPRIEFYLMGNSKADKSNWLSKYRNNTLRKDWHALLDEHLNDDVKDWIKSLPAEKLHQSNAS